MKINKFRKHVLRACESLSRIEMSMSATYLAVDYLSNSEGSPRLETVLTFDYGSEGSLGEHLFGQLDSESSTASMYMRSLNTCLEITTECVSDLAYLYPNLQKIDPTDPRMGQMLHRAIDRIKERCSSIGAMAFGYDDVARDHSMFISDVLVYMPLRCWERYVIDRTTRGALTALSAAQGAVQAVRAVMRHVVRLGQSRPLPMLKMAMADRILFFDTQPLLVDHDESMTIARGLRPAYRSNIVHDSVSAFASLEDPEVRNILKITEDAIGLVYCYIPWPQVRLVLGCARAALRLASTVGALASSSKKLANVVTQDRYLDLRKRHPIRTAGLVAPSALVEVCLPTTRPILIPL